MATAAPTTVVDSKSKTLMEASLFAVPVLLGGGMFLLSLASAPGAGDTLFALAGGLMVGFYLLILGLALAMPFALYFDAKAVGQHELEWEPTAILYAIGGLFLSGLLVMHYLYKRYQYTADADTRDSWWYVVAAYPVVLVISAVALFTGFPTVAFVFGGAVSALTPIALYKDAAHLRTKSDGWLPNPINYYLGFVFGAFLVVVPVLVCLYYLFRRHRSVGLA